MPILIPKGIKVHNRLYLAIAGATATLISVGTASAETVGDVLGDALLKLDEQSTMDCSASAAADAVGDEQLSDSALAWLRYEENMRSCFWPFLLQKFEEFETRETVDDVRTFKQSLYAAKDDVLQAVYLLGTQKALKIDDGAGEPYVVGDYSYLSWGEAVKSHVLEIQTCLNDLFRDVAIYEPQDTGPYETPNADTDRLGNSAPYKFNNDDVSSIKV
ncbi:MAG: hypothetical protein AAGC77_04460, partial [Pseudomonadota bacterium]